MMNLEFDGADIRITSNRHVRDGGSQSAIVTFSARSKQAISPAFGDRYLESRKIPAVHIQSKWNHWWHTDEALEIPLILQRLNIRRPYLYGSSMGGYAALMFGGRLNAAGAIALSPIVYVSPSLGSFDSRWDEDRKQFLCKFDEEICLRQTARISLWAFMDPKHQSDYPHLDILKRVCVQSGALDWSIVEVPYGYHPVTPSLQKAGVLEFFFSKLKDGVRPDIAEIEYRCSRAYEHDPKSLANYLRQVDDVDVLKAYAQRFEAIYDSGPHDDHEFSFICAEVFLKLGMPALALQASKKTVASRVVPAWIAMKHANIIAAVQGSSIAADYLLTRLSEEGNQDLAISAATMLRRANKHKEALQILASSNCSR